MSKIQGHGWLKDAGRSIQ